MMHAPMKTVPILRRHHMYGRAPSLRERSFHACPHLGHARGTNASPDAAKTAKAAPAGVSASPRLMMFILMNKGVSAIK
eukprot:2715554-Amphidinium_carterae.1